MDAGGEFRRRLGHMKVSKQRESASMQNKRASMRGRRISGSTGGSALDVATGGHSVVDSTRVANSAELAVAAIEQRRDSPTVPAPLTEQAMSTDAIESDLANAVVPGAAQTTEPSSIQAPTEQEIAAAIAEGAATPFAELVVTDGIQAEPPVLDAEQAGKAESVAKAPEL